MPYPTSQASPLMLLAALQQQQQNPTGGYGGFNGFNPAALAPVTPQPLQRGQNVEAGMGGGMGHIPVIGQQNGSGVPSGLGSLQQIAALKNLFGSNANGNQNVGGLLDFSGNPMSTASGYGNSFGSLGDWLQGAFGSGAVSPGQGWASGSANALGSDVYGSW